MTLTTGMLVFVAFLGSQTVATIVGRWLNRHDAKLAQEAAARAVKAVEDAEIARLQQQEDTARAIEKTATVQLAVAAAADKLQRSTQATNARLDALKVGQAQIKEDTGSIAEIKGDTKVIHHLANSQHMTGLRIIADLRGQIARQNPNDQQAQGAAKLAYEELKAAESSIDEATPGEAG